MRKLALLETDRRLRRAKLLKDIESVRRDLKRRKVCICCKVRKDFTHFTNDKSRKDGKGAYCNICRKKITAGLRFREGIRQRQQVELQLLKDKGIKKCTRCKAYKKRSEFTIARAEFGGLSCRCRDCRDSKKKSRATAFHREVNGKYRKENKEKLRAHNIMKLAIKKGRLIKKPCAVCDKGAEESVGHHDNYSKPTKIRWLCGSHHSSYHWEMKRRGLKYGEALEKNGDDIIEELKRRQRLDSAFD